MLSNSRERIKVIHLLAGPLVNWHLVF